MVGGTTSGYSLIGRRHRAMNPRRKMMVESTPAKIGRRMKKFEKVIAKSVVERCCGTCDIQAMTALTSEALRLAPQERLKLIEEVWESLAAEPASLPVDAEQLDEMERRRSRYASDPASLIDCHELKTKLQRRGDAH